MPTELQSSWDGDDGVEWRMVRGVHEAHEQGVGGQQGHACMALMSRHAMPCHAMPHSPRGHSLESAQILHVEAQAASLR